MKIICVFNFKSDDDRKTLFKEKLFPSPGYNVRWYATNAQELFQKNRTEVLKKMNVDEPEYVKLVFMHATPLCDKHENLSDALIKKLIQKIKTWDNSWTRCGGLVFYSGGWEHRTVNSIREELKKEGLCVKLLDKAIHDQEPKFLQKLCLHAENKEWSPFLNCTPESDSDPEQRYLKRITALDILLQEYLAISDKIKFFNQGSEKETQDFLKIYKILQGEQQNEATKFMANDRLFRNKNINGSYGQDKTDANDPKEDGYFWFDECLTEPIPDKTDINSLKSVEEVWDLIYCVYNGNISNIPDAKTLTTLFQEAHDEYIFFRKKKQREKAESA